MGDRDPGSRALRALGDGIRRRRYADVLAQVDELLHASRGASAREARLLALAGDVEFERGRFVEAGLVYRRSLSLARESARGWLRPGLGAVRAALGAGDLKAADAEAAGLLAIAMERSREFDAALDRAARRVQAGEVVDAPARPPAPASVAARLGRQFLLAGETPAAETLLRWAVAQAPGGLVAARMDLARLALASNRPHEAMAYAREALHAGGYGARVIAAWPLLVAARRAAGGWRIAEGTLAGLQQAAPGVRGRATLEVVRALRNADMRQWRDVADGWLAREGEKFPIVAAELRKLLLADAKAAAASPDRLRREAEALLAVPGLGPREWLSATKTWIESSLWLTPAGAVPLAALLRDAARRYGDAFRPTAAHSLALSCMMARRHDLARGLLAPLVDDASVPVGVWSRAAWALARMEAWMGRQDRAATLYRRVAVHREVPKRIRLQAGVLRARALVAGGNAAGLLSARGELDALLGTTADADLVLDFARQLRAAGPELASWSEELYARGRDAALASYRAATHPAVAVGILHRLARRQVYDFNRYAETVALWNSLGDAEIHRLWSRDATFWEYVALVVEAHGRIGGPGRARAFAQPWMDDPATPPEGFAWVGAALVRTLLSFQQWTEGLALCERLTCIAPSHRACAMAYYALALAARRRGLADASAALARNIRRVQGASIGLLEEWQLDAKALLLMADLDVARVDLRAVNYTREDLERYHADILADLAVCP